MARSTFLLAAAASVSAAAASASPLPNLLFILADDLGFSELSIQPRGPLNNTNITTPAIDALFKSGTQFSDAYTGEAVCAPSRGSLFTGLHTGHATIRGNAPGADGHGLPLPPREKTVFQVAKEAGYRVACVGKWGVGWWNSTGAPDVKGCDSYFGVLDQSYAHNMYPSAPDFTWRKAPGAPPVAVPYPENVNASRERCMQPGNTCTWAHKLWTDEATAVLAEQARLEAGARAAGAAAPPPLFLYLAYTDPHAGGWSGEAEEGNPVPSNAGPRVDFQNQPWPNPEKDHASVIANYLDADVGALVALLEKGGMRSNTAVFFASDNGASNEGAHDYMCVARCGGAAGPRFPSAHLLYCFAPPPTHTPHVPPPPPPRPQVLRLLGPPARLQALPHRGRHPNPLCRVLAGHGARGARVELPHRLLGLFAHHCGHCGRGPAARH